MDPVEACERAWQVEEFVDSTVESAGAILSSVRQQIDLQNVYSLYAGIIKRYEGYTARVYLEKRNIKEYSKYRDYLGRAISELGLASRAIA